MAQLKDTIVSGSLRATDTIYTNNLQSLTFNTYSSSAKTAYGVGTDGQVLRSDGTNTYWGDITAGVSGIKGSSESSYRTGNVNLTAANIGLGNVENTKLSTWAGSSNITTVGTISSGTWNATTIGVGRGGTGATTPAGARTNLELGTAATYNVGSGNSTTTYIPTVINGALEIGQYIDFHLTTEASEDFATRLSVASTGFYITHSNTTASNIYLNSKKAFSFSDTWLRINEVPANGFASGVYFGGSTVRTDGRLEIGDAGSSFYVTADGIGYLANTLTINGSFYMQKTLNSTTNYYPVLLKDDSDSNITYNGIGGPIYLGWYNITGVYVGPGSNGWKSFYDGAHQYAISRNVDTDGNGNIYASPHYGAAIEIREVNEVSTNQTDEAYCPRIGFHWSGRWAAWFGLLSDGHFKLGRENAHYGLNVGPLNIYPENNGGWAEGIRIHAASDGWSTIALCDSTNTGYSGTSTNTWSIHNYLGDFYITKSGSSSGTTSLKCVNNVWNFTSSLQVDNEIICTSANAIRFTYNSVGSVNENGQSVTNQSLLLRNDGHYFWFLCCNSDSPGDNWYGPHPLFIDLASHYVYSYRLYGAVWNDYAEYRDIETKEPGRCVQENDNGHMTITQKRLIPGSMIISDTYGFAEGETEICNTPVAVAGRVLAYTYQDRNKYHAGQAVCSAPNGTIDIMTREEIQQYPDAIIGIVSEIPNYDEWGSGKVKINGRIWIKVK